MNYQQRVVVQERERLARIWLMLGLIGTFVLMMAIIISLITDTYRSRWILLFAPPAVFCMVMSMYHLAMALSFKPPRNFGRPDFGDQEQAEGMH